MKDYLLQNRINELDSAIINFIGEKVFITGFYNENRLSSHLELGKDNWRSKGIYDKSDISFSNIKNNALFVVKEDGKIVKKHKFTVYKREIVQRKSEPGPLILTIRKHEFTEQWQIYVLKEVHTFLSKQEMKTFLMDNYRFDFEI